MDNSPFKRLCVFVKVYNEYEMLEDLVNSLKNQSLQPSKVIIIDDGSPNPQVSKEINRLAEKHLNLNIELLQLPLKKNPNLDDVGRTFKTAWLKEKKNGNFDYIGTLDADTRLEPRYYQTLVQEMEKNTEIGCASGVIIIRSKNKEYVEKINIGAKFGRKDARGSGKVIRVSLLQAIDEADFPEVDWDTWINAKAKIRNFKTPQIDQTYMYQERPTSRVVKKDIYRSGRLTYHFGYNPILLGMKIVLAGRGGLTLLRGYINARGEKWQLKDKEVRKYFGWKFFLHF